MCCRRTALTHAEHASAHQTHPETRSDAAQAKLEGPSSSSAAATRQPPSQRHVSSSLSAGGDESRQRLPHYSASPPPPLLPPPSLEAALARRWLTIDRQVMVLTAAVRLPECLTRWAAAQAAALVAAVDCPHLPAAHAHNARSGQAVPPQVHMCTLARFTVTRSEEQMLRGMLASLVAAFLLTSVAPRWYLAARQVRRARLLLEWLWHHPALRAAPLVLGSSCTWRSGSGQPAVAVDGCTGHAARRSPVAHLVPPVTNLPPGLPAPCSPL